MTATTAKPLRSGFTLIELLVAMAVLAIILVATLQITTSARDSVSWAEKEIASEGDARQFANLLGRDLIEMIRRDDAPFEFKTQAGNDELAFLATRSGYADGDSPAERAASRVHYGMDANGRLTRACLGFAFDGGASLSLDPDALLEKIPGQNRQIISDHIFRIEIEFLVNSGGAIVRQQQAPAELGSLRGVISSVALLDPLGQAMLRRGGLQTLASVFPDAGSAESPAVIWTETLERHSARGIDGIPAAVFRGVRVYEHNHFLD